MINSFKIFHGHYEKIQTKESMNNFTAFYSTKYDANEIQTEIITISTTFKKCHLLLGVLEL